MRNVGRGPAFVRKAEFVTGKRIPEEAATAHNAVLPVNECTEISYTIKRAHPFYGMLTESDRPEFAVAINYDDISGKQHTRSVMRIRRKAESDEFELLGVPVYGCNKHWKRGPKPLAGDDPYAGDIVQRQ
jgi:hypothetical protein